MDKSIKILHLEDLPSDALFVKKALLKANIDFTELMVDSRDKYVAALEDFLPDLILADHSLPSFNSVEALKILRESGKEIPFIVITAAMSDESAVNLLMKGADDYILKDRLSRLPIAIFNALEKYRLKKEHQKFLDELIISEQRYRALIEHSADGVVILDAQGLPTYVSVSVTNVLGYLPSELVGKDMFRLIHPDDTLDMGIMLKKILDSPGITLKGHTGRMLHKDGSWRWIEATVTNLLDDPAVNGIVDNFRDITERKLAQDAITASEEKYRLLFETSIDGILLTLQDGQVLEANQAACNIFEMAEHEIISAGRSGLADLDDPRLSALLDERLQTGKANGAFFGQQKNAEQHLFQTERHPETASGKARAGSLKADQASKNYNQTVDSDQIVHFEDYYEPLDKWLEVSAYPWVNGLSVYFKNITERKLSEKKLIELNKSLHQYSNELALSNKGLEQFSYMVSHNLRAPVANIIGLASLLSDESYTPDLKTEFLNGILDNVKRLDDVITDLNSILQVKREIGEKSESVNLQDLVDSIKDSIQNLIQKENVSIKTDFTQAHELFTLKTYLYSIFHNLIINSIKYHQPGVSPVIEIGSSVSDGKLTLSFKDNGLGIDLSKRGEQLFGLYKRFHHHVEGKGMGLFMVKTQVEILGGTISVLSEINSGTEFLIKFNA